MTPKTTTIKAILFDLGNVLVFFNARRASKAFAETLGMDEEEIWSLVFISQLEKRYTRGEVTTDEFFRQVSEHFPKQIDLATFSKYWNEIFDENVAMRPVLDKLKVHYPLYLISNTNELHFDYIRANYKVLDGFTRCFPSHQVGLRKPDPKIFQHVLKEIPYRAEETVFIDDIQEFVDAAKSCGIHGVQFTSISGLEEGLRALGVKI